MDAAAAGLIGAGIGGGFTLVATWLTAGLHARQAERDRRRGLADHVAHELARVEREVIQTEELGPMATRARLGEVANELMTLRQTRLYGVAEEGISEMVGWLVEVANRLAWRGPEWEDEWDDSDGADSDATAFSALLTMFRLTRRVLGEYVNPTRIFVRRLGRRILGDAGLRAAAKLERRRSDKFDRRLDKLHRSLKEEGILDPAEPQDS